MAQNTLDQNEGDFVRGIRNATGIDQRVIIAWMYQEGAFKEGGTGGFNYLNIAPFSGDNRSGLAQNGFSQFANVHDAILATAHVIKQKNMSTILHTASLHPTPRQQIGAIAASPWDSGHYGGKGGPQLEQTFTDLFGHDPKVLDTPWQGADIAEGFKSDAADWTSYDIHSAVSDIGSAINVVGSIADAIKWIFGNWDRVFLVLGGAVGLLIAIILLAKSQQSNTFTFSRGE